MASLGLHLQAHTTIELARILDHAFWHMLPNLQRELIAPPPSDTVERDECVAIWTARLENIKSALGSFPTLRNASATTTPDSPSGATTPTRSIPSNQARETDCLERDQYACITTGRKMSDGFVIEAAQIIPHALAMDHSCRSLDFWKMLDIFYSAERTDTIFAAVAGNTDGLENLVALDNSMHFLFEHGRMTLTPQTIQGVPISVTAEHTGDYYLSVGYPEGMKMPEFIVSIKIIGAVGEARTLYGGSLVPILHRRDTPDHARTLPQPALFALRSSILDLKRLCTPGKPTTIAPTDNDSDGDGDLALWALSATTDTYIEWVRSGCVGHGSS